MAVSEFSEELQNMEVVLSFSNKKNLPGLFGGNKKYNKTWLKCVIESYNYYFGPK